MMHVNLLPAEFRTREGGREKASALQIILSAVILFVAATVYFYVDFAAAEARLIKLSRKWEYIQPEYKVLTQLQKELEGPLKDEKDFMERFVTTKRPLTHMMAWISEKLPGTAWLTEVRLERGEDGQNLLVKGLALPSKERSSIEQIELYLHELKQEMPDANLSLTTTRQIMNDMELTQFTANFGWGQRMKVKS